MCVCVREKGFKDVVLLRSIGRAFIDPSWVYESIALIDVAPLTRVVSVSGGGAGRRKAFDLVGVQLRSSRNYLPQSCQ